MEHTLITHVIVDGLPEKGHKFITPICSSEEELEKGNYFLGYDGSRPLDLETVKSTYGIRTLQEPFAMSEDKDLHHILVDPTEHVFWGKFAEPKETWVSMLLQEKSA